MYLFVIISTIELILINIAYVIGYKQLNLIDTISKRLIKNEHTITFLDTESENGSEASDANSEVHTENGSEASNEAASEASDANSEAEVVDLKEPQFEMDANVWNAFLKDDQQYKEALKSLTACYNTITKNMKNE